MDRFVQQSEGLVGRNVKLRGDAVGCLRHSETKERGFMLSCTHVKPFDRTGTRDSDKA